MNSQKKMVSRENAYEVWQTLNGTWTWYVRKKYQNEKNEKDNPLARWFCDVVTPIVPSGESGDVYVVEIKSVAKRIK